MVRAQATARGAGCGLGQVSRILSPVTEADFHAWVKRYMVAWGSNDPDEIGGLFTDHAEYYTAPFRAPWQGREAIVAGWLEHKDELGDYDFRHQMIAVAGDLGFVRGWTRYLAGEYKGSFSNLWMIRLAPDGRATSFTEWWMEEPASA
jgi:SnoaL-like domain